MSLIHFELLFVMVEVRSNFILLWISSFSNTICWKDWPFHIEWSWDPCQKSFDCVSMGLFLRSLLCSIDFYVFLLVPHCLVYCNFVTDLGISKCKISTFLLFSFFPKIILAIWMGFLKFHMNFQMDFSISYKKWHCDFDCLGLYWQLNNIKSFNPWTWDVFYLCVFFFG